MCQLWQQQQDLAKRMAEAVPLHPKEQAWWHYLLLILVTETPFNKAVTYLKDTGSAEAATGRLLLRAAERSLREYGDTPDGGKQEGDEG